MQDKTVQFTNMNLIVLRYVTDRLLLNAFKDVHLYWGINAFSYLSLELTGPLLQVVSPLVQLRKLAVPLQHLDGYAT